MCQGPSKGHVWFLGTRQWGRDGRIPSSVELCLGQGASWQGQEECEAATGLSSHM